MAMVGPPKPMDGYEMAGIRLNGQSVFLLLSMAVVVLVAGCSSEPPKTRDAGQKTQPVTMPRQETQGIQQQDNSSGLFGGSRDSGGNEGSEPAMPPSGRFGRGFDRSDKEPRRVGEVDGDQFVVTRGMVAVRATPNGRAIAMAYANDRLVVLDTKDDWVQVRLPNNQVGWVPQQE